MGGQGAYRRFPRRAQPVWNFHIGGYQVCEKWLKDRKGRTRTKDDIAHYHKIVVAELNDEGIYGYGQLAMMLRARYAMPNIESVTKTDGLTFKVSEIVAGVAKHIESTELDATLGVAHKSALAAN